MKLKRREFVKIGASGFLLAWGFPRSLFGQKTGDFLSNYSMDSFRKLIGANFSFWNNKNVISSTLSSVEELPKGTKSGECFSLVFDIQNQEAIQETYRAFNSEMGNFDIFLTEGRNGSNGALIAMFNRI